MEPRVAADVAAGRRGPAHGRSAAGWARAWSAPARLCLLLLLLLVPCRPGAAAAEDAPGRRVALVVGNAAYRSLAGLANPANDAALIARTLQALGFALVGNGPQLNLDKPAFDAAVQQFGAALADAEVGLFYYAGHGLQVGGTNWLVPVGANPSGPQDLDFQMVDAGLVLKQMQYARTRLNVMILDACRNNPFGGRGLRAAGGGLTEMRAPSGTLIAYATQPGNVARDGEGANSPFSSALAATLVRPGLDVFRLFNQVGLAVSRQTGGDQQPWVSSSPIEGEFLFAGAPGAAAAPVPAPVPEADAEGQAWQAARDSGDPAALRAYLSRFPRGRYAEQARLGLKPPALPPALPPAEARVPVPAALPVPPRPARPAGQVPSLFLAGTEALNAVGYQAEQQALSYARQFDPARGPTGRETSASLGNPIEGSQREALRVLEQALAGGRGGGSPAGGFAEVTEPVALPAALGGTRGVSFGPVPTLPEAAERFLAAAATLGRVLEEAKPYYDRENWRDDRFARGRAMHGGIVAAYRDFLLARVALTEALRPLAAGEREGFLAAQPPGKGAALDATLRALSQGRQMVRFIASSLDANPNPRAIDQTRLRAEADQFERALGELQARVHGGDGKVSEAVLGGPAAIRMGFVLDKAEALLQTTRTLQRALRDRQPINDLYFSFRTGYEGDILTRFDNLVGSVNLLVRS